MEPTRPQAAPPKKNWAGWLAPPGPAPVLGHGLPSGIARYLLRWPQSLSGRGCWLGHFQLPTALVNPALGLGDGFHQRGKLRSVECSASLPTAALFEQPADENLVAQAMFVLGFPDASPNDSGARRVGGRGGAVGILILVCFHGIIIKRRRNRERAWTQNPGGAPWISGR